MVAFYIVGFIVTHILAYSWAHLYSLSQHSHEVLSSIKASIKIYSVNWCLKLRGVETSFPWSLGLVRGWVITLTDSFGINFLGGRISAPLYSYLDWGSFAKTLLFFLWQTDTFIIIITHKCCYVSHQQIITACCSDWQQNNLHPSLIWMERWRVKLFCVSNVLNRKDISKKTHTWSERNGKKMAFYVRSSLYSLFYFSYCYTKMPFGIKILIFKLFSPNRTHIKRID